MTDTTNGEGAELSPQDEAELEALLRPKPPREIAREIHGYAHPEDEPELMRETWIQGSYKSEDDSEILLRLDHGVGQGHAHLSLMVEIDGERIAWEYVDMTTLVEHWAQAIVDDHMIKLAADELDKQAAAEGAAEDRAVDDSRGIDS